VLVGTECRGPTTKALVLFDESSGRIISIMHALPDEKENTKEGAIFSFDPHPGSRAGNLEFLENFSISEALNFTKNCRWI
jgi:hypothetical protein